MPVLLWALKYWKEVALSAIILGIGGYILVLRASVNNLEKENVIREQNISTLTTDLENAKAGIDNVNAAVVQYQKYVAASFASVERTQKKISTENRQLQAMLDNIAMAAMRAERIIDAPRIPFFTEARAVPLDFIGMDNGAYVYRVRPEGAEADRRPELSPGDPR